MTNPRNAEATAKATDPNTATPEVEKDDDYCKCDRPKVRIMYDDLGRPVKYCDYCWTVIH